MVERNAAPGVEDTHRVKTFMPSGPAFLVGLFAVCLAAIEIVVDWTTWIELNVSMVYSLPLVVASAARDRRLLWALTSLLLAMTFIVYSVQSTADHFSLQDPYFVDRFLASITIFLTAVLLHVLMLARDALEYHERSLNEQNVVLARANADLAESRQAIARQNDELDDRRRQAEEASVRKTRMLAALSHDIRTPLQAITLMAEVLQVSATRPELVPGIPHLAQRLRANAQSMVEMLSEVIDDSTIESGRLSLNIRRFLLNELLAGEFYRLQPLAQAKDLDFDLEPVDVSLVLLTDRIKLARILGNLLSNAIKFTDAGGVTLSARLAPDGDLLIKVKDTGRGIDPESLGRIFDEFSQVPELRRSIAAGWGLGLSISHRLINLIGGTISVESVVGKGTVFTVRLPKSCVLGPSHSSPGPSPIE